MVLVVAVVLVMVGVVMQEDYILNGMFEKNIFAMSHVMDDEDIISKSHWRFGCSNTPIRQQYLNKASKITLALLLRACGWRT